MKFNRKYLIDRIILLLTGMFTLCFFAVIVLISVALKTGKYWTSIILITIALVALAVLFVFWILIPYKRMDKNIYLFMSGYTAAGLKDAEMTISPATEQMFQTVLRILESDELLSANKRQAQYLALQNQINPHFLYNTLESIRSEAMEAGIYNVMNMTEALANFFRYTISKVENMVTLEEELQNIQTYFYIQQYRFEDRISLSIVYDPEEYDMLRRCLLPKLTLQPVVENSIIHGLERKLGKGTVTIRITVTEKRLLITISDDGIGMDEETFAKLNRHLSQPVLESSRMSKNRGGIALVNVNNRIHLIFGEEYGMSIMSVEGCGTDVSINLPVATSKRQVKNGEEFL